jgi:hypothetical protein
MTTGESVYLIIVILCFASFCGTLAWASVQK